MRGITTAAWLCLGLFSVAHAEKTAYENDWMAFTQVIDENYPFFDLKNIRSDWNATKRDSLKRAQECPDDDAFLRLIVDAIQCLRDGHAGIVQSRIPAPKEPDEFCLPVALMPATGQRVIAMSVLSSHAPAEIKPGTVIETIDGHPARDYLENLSRQNWDKGGSFSSPHRARLFTYRRPLQSSVKTGHVITYLTPEGEKSITLLNDEPALGWAHTYHFPTKTTVTGEGCFYKQLSSGVGYLYLRKINGNETARGLLAALAASPGAAGWIIDIRGNGGGGYGNELRSALEKIPQPVAVLVDAGTISAAETLARDLKTLAHARLFGDTTAGSSSQKMEWHFPSGIATVRFSTVSRRDQNNNMIEFNGIEPDVFVEAIPEEVQAGLNSEMLRAESYLLEVKSGNASR